MGGGLLNLIAYGNQNIILNGNPTKTMFSCVYAKYTNFGLQKFQIHPDGNHILKQSESTTFNFKVPRNGDLLMDTYLVVTLPDIWSPIHPPSLGVNGGKWRAYEFKWIKNLGTQMIKKVKILVGGQILQEFSGQYLHNMVERDFNESKKNVFYNMTGHVTELNDPKNGKLSVANKYPSAYKLNTDNDPDPSITGRKIYIPLNAWFSLSSKMAFPLTSMQYNELHIQIEIRPIKELFVVKDVSTAIDAAYEKYIKPTNDTLFDFKRFLYVPVQPTQVDGAANTDWELDYSGAQFSNDKWGDGDIHLISTYAFLSEDEVRQFALNEQKYLIKQVYEHINVSDAFTGYKKLELKSSGLVANWMWYLQRDDVNDRNEWSNYTNWKYADTIPVNTLTDITANVANIGYGGGNHNPSTHPVGGVLTTGYEIMNTSSNANTKNIMVDMGIWLDGKVRENTLDAGIYNYIEKYFKSKGNSQDGLYSYTFSLTTDPYDCQPSGAINLSKFNKIEFELNTITLRPAGETYKYKLFVFEERYNILHFMSGNAGLVYHFG